MADFIEPSDMVEITINIPEDVLEAVEEAAAELSKRGHTFTTGEFICEILEDWNEEHQDDRLGDWLESIYEGKKGGIN